MELPSLTACASSTCNSRQIAALRSLGVNNDQVSSEQEDLASSTARWKIWKNTAYLRTKVAICAPRVCLVDLGSAGPHGRTENSAPVALLRLVPKLFISAGYNRFSFTRASAVVNCQSALTCLRLRVSSQAATSSMRLSVSGIRRSRH